MNKILRYSFVALLAMVFGNVMADEATFDFDNGATLFGLPGESNNNGGTDGDFTEAKTATIGNYSVTVSPAADGATNANRIWNATPKLRMYSGNMTIKAANGAVIKSITFNLHTQASKAKWNADNTVSTGSIDASAKTTAIWTGEATEIVLNVAGNTQITNMVISSETGGGTPEPQPQPSDQGTFENPLTVAQVLAAVSAMPAGEVSESDYIFKGKICSIKYTFSAQYGTATFNVSDNGEAGNEFTCYSVYYLENKSWVDGNTQIAVGDEVIICGKVVNYQGTTPETSSKNAYIYSLNGKTKEEGGTPGPEIERITVAKALEIIAALDPKTTTSETYEIEGIVANLTEEFNPNYGNYTFDMKDEGGSTTLLVFRAKDADNQKFTEDVLHVNDKVLVKAQLQKYGDDNIPETKNAVILTINGTPTAIETVKADVNFNGKIYNMAGQVVNKGYKGLVIMNGKKLLQK